MLTAQSTPGDVRTGVLASLQQFFPQTRLPVTDGGRPTICRWLLPVVNCALALALAAPAAATVLLPADFGEMVEASQLIVHGRVLEVRPQMTDGRRTIETIVTLSVVQPLKGNPGSTLVFRVPNGQVGRYRRVMVGAPEFSEGDEIVLFLKGRAPTIPMPFGLSQGVYRVARDSAGRPVVTPLVVDRPGRVVRGDAGRRPLAIDEFARQVRTLTENQP